MAILAQCPICRKKQSLKNKTCKCGQDMDKAKRSNRVRYWIHFRLPDGKQRMESVDFSIEKARDAEGKRRSQKRENRIFDILPESKITFYKLAEWYLGLKSVKGLASFDRVEQALNQFNLVFGDRRVKDVIQTDLEDYQDKRKNEDRAAATIDMEIKYGKKMITKAFDNDMIDGRTLKAFRKTKKLLKTGSNARQQLISFEQYVKLIASAPPHFEAVLIIAFHTGMRLGEIRLLKWSYIDRKNMMIRLPKEIVKEERPKNIPINHHVVSAIDAIPKALHHDFVITYMGMPMNGKNSLKKQFPETCQKATIDYGRKAKGGITFHDIRRTVKTNMANAGIDKVYRDTILGHSLKGMDAHYIVLTDESLTKAMDSYTEWFDMKLENVNQNVNQTGVKSH